MKLDRPDHTFIKNTSKIIHHRAGWIFKAYMTSNHISSQVGTGHTNDTEISYNSSLNAKGKHTL